MSLRNKLVEDFDRVVEDAAKLEKMLKELQGEAAERASDVAKATREEVRENPWRSVGIAAAIGAAVGFAACAFATHR